MATLTISGNGVWVLSCPLEENQAREYAETGIIDECDHENYTAQADGCGWGFDADADVFFNDIGIGTIRSLIKKGAHEKYKRLHDALDAEVEIHEDNVFVQELAIQGICVTGEIPDYDIKDEKNIPQEFIIDFLSNLDSDYGGYSLSSWDDHDLDGGIEDTWTKDIYEYVIYAGKKHEFSVQSSEDDDN